MCGTCGCKSAETKKRKTGFRKCSKCGYSDHNSSNCNRLDEYETYRKHKDEMLKECDDAIQSFTRSAKRYSEDGEYGLAKMLRSDATDMKKLKRMIEKNHFGKAVHFAMTMDSDPRELAPSALWMFDAEEVKLSKTSCCCGADEANPCACMKAPEPMNCSATEPKCQCYKELDAETFNADVKMNDRAWVAYYEYDFMNVRSENPEDMTGDSKMVSFRDYRKELYGIYLTTQEAKKAFNLLKGSLMGHGDWKEGQYRQVINGYKQIYGGTPQRKTIPMQMKFEYVPIRRFGYDTAMHTKSKNAETFEASVVRQGKAPKGAMAKAMMNQSMMEQANIEAVIQELENKVNLGLINEDDLMASLKKKFGAEYDIEELSKEDLEAYFADLKKDNPKLAKIIEFKVKNEEYLPKKMIEDSGYDYEILEAWNDYVVDDDKYALFDPCPACEGEGWVMTSYTPATRFEPADGDGEDCGDCGGSGKIDPSDYMYYGDKGEIEYAAESFETEYIMEDGWLAVGKDSGMNGEWFCNNCGESYGMDMKGKMLAYECFKNDCKGDGTLTPQDMRYFQLHNFANDFNYYFPVFKGEKQPEVEMTYNRDERRGEPYFSIATGYHSKLDADGPIGNAYDGFHYELNKESLNRLNQFVDDYNRKNNTRIKFYVNYSEKGHRSGVDVKFTIPSESFEAVKNTKRRKEYAAEGYEAVNQSITSNKIGESLAWDNRILGMAGKWRNGKYDINRIKQSADIIGYTIVHEDYLEKKLDWMENGVPLGSKSTDIAEITFAGMKIYTGGDGSFPVMGMYENINDYYARTQNKPHPRGNMTMMEFFDQEDYEKAKYEEKKWEYEFVEWVKETYKPAPTYFDDGSEMPLYHHVAEKIGQENIPKLLVGARISLHNPSMPTLNRRDSKSSIWVLEVPDLTHLKTTKYKQNYRGKTEVFINTETTVNKFFSNLKAIYPKGDFREGERNRRYKQFTINIPSFGEYTWKCNEVMLAYDSVSQNEERRRQGVKRQKDLKKYRLLQEEEMKALKEKYGAETFDDMKIKYDNRDRIFFIKSVDYDTDGEIENDELPQEFTIKIPSEYHYFDENTDEGDITDVLNEWISTETGFSTNGIVWIEEENNSWRKNAEYDEEDMVSCRHCWNEIGNEKEVYGDETVDYEMANGELVCLPCHKIWIDEYKNDLDPHYSPFYAEEVKKNGDY